MRFLDLKRVRKPLPPRKNTKRVWSAIRQQRRFTLAQIAAITELTERAVSQILQPWRRAGVIRIDSDGFRIARDLGPLPPFSYGKVAGLVDRRTGEVLPFAPLPRAPRRRRATTAPAETAARPRAKSTGRPKGTGRPKAKVSLTPAQQLARLQARRACSNAYAKRNRDGINARRRIRRRERRAEQVGT